MKQLKDYLDFWGLLTESNGDGGDTSHKIGFFGVASYFTKKYQKDISNITGWDSELDEDFYKSMRQSIVRRDGIGRRHPDNTKWYSSPSEYSRDNQTPIVIASGFNDDKEIVKKLLVEHLKRFGKYQNFDFATPEHFGYYFRALNWWWMYPFLLLGDMFMLLNVFILKQKKKLQTKDFHSDNILHLLAVLQAKERLPTFISRIVRKLTKNNLDPMDSLIKYFGPNERDGEHAPPIHKLFEIFLDKEL